MSELRPQAAIAPYLRAAVVQQTLVDFDPKNTVAWNNLASVQWSTSEAYWTMGQVDDALEMLDAIRTTARTAGEGGTWSRLGQLRLLSHAVMRNADAGHFDKARDIVDEIGSHIPALQKNEPKGSLAAPSAVLQKLRAESRIAISRGDARAARKICTDMNARLQAMQATGDADLQFKYAQTYMANDVKAQSELALKEFEAAEQSARAALTAKEHWVYDPAGDTRVKAGVSTLIALALVGQGKPSEARQVIEPA
jgi:hypothetical protein